MQIPLIELKTVCRGSDAALVADSKWNDSVKCSKSVQQAGLDNCKILLVKGSHLEQWVSPVQMVCCLIMQTHEHLVIPSSSRICQLLHHVLALLGICTMSCSAYEELQWGFPSMMYPVIMFAAVITNCSTETTSTLDEHVFCNCRVRSNRKF